MTERGAVAFSLRQIRYFLAAAETLSITDGARRLHISQPSVSTSISSLEEILGVQLFIRHHAQGLSLTPAGHVLAAEARALLKHADELQATLGQFSSTSSGPLSIGFLVTLAPILLPTLTKGFLSQHPKVQLVPSEGHQAKLLESLRGGAIDCAVTYDLGVPSEFRFQPLAVLPPLALLPADHRLADRSSVSLVELSREPMVLLDLPLSREYFLSLFVGVDVRPAISYRSSFADVVHAMVASGFGYTLWNYPLPMLQSNDRNPIVCRPLQESLMPARLGLVSLDSAYPRKILGTFYEHCSRTLRDIGGVGGIEPIGSA